MFDFFGDFNDLFQQTRYWFDRPVKDQQPYSIRAHDKGFIITVNTLGIAKENLSISMSKPKGVPESWKQLNIQGKSKIEKINFENTINLQLLLKFDRKVESLSYECKDGLTLIYIKVEQPKKEIESGIVNAKLVDENDTDPFDF